MKLARLAVFTLPLALVATGCATQSGESAAPATVTETISGDWGTTAQTGSAQLLDSSDSYGSAVSSADYVIGEDTPVDSQGSMLDIVLDDPSPIAGNLAELKCMELVANQYVPEQKPVKFPEIESSTWKVWQVVEGVSEGTTAYAAKMHFSCHVSGGYAELSTFVPE